VKGSHQLSGILVYKSNFTAKNIVAFRPVAQQILKNKQL
jgi:hypothetical protein